MIFISFGKTVSNIRKNKHIPISLVTNSTITKSSYTRFVEGKTQPSINSFITILDNLHVNFEEFLYIERGFKPNYFNQMINKIQGEALKCNIPALTQMHETFAVYNYQEPHNETYLHFKCVTKLIINYIEEEPFDKESKKVLLDYLTKCEIWTHYEHMLFNCVIFIFDIDRVKAMENCIIKNLDNYQLLHTYGNEGFRTLIIILAFYILNEDLLAAIKVIGKLEEFKLQDYMIFEKNLYKLFSGIVFVLSKEETGFKNIEEALQVFKLTDANEYIFASIGFLKRICKIYDYHHPQLDKIYKMYADFDTPKPNY